MNIEIIGTESLGVRGLCCFVETKNKKILIDPGIALGYKRYGLLPHPVQIAVDERIQKKIIDKWKEATDIIISHFHGDHVPLADANPYQFGIKKVIGLNQNVNIWAKDPSHFSAVEKKRAEHLSIALNKDLIIAEEKKEEPMTFSKAMPHGEAYDNSETVMMSRIEGDNKTFVHTSDIQLLNDESISQILHWKPSIVLADGPPLYLSKLSENQIKKAWSNAKKLSAKVDVLILDHHLLRNYDGAKWIKRLSSETKKMVMCGADFMKKPRRLLEAKREKLYKDMPVLPGWHEDYAKGKAKPTTKDYWDLNKKLYKSIKNS